jgi:hypothetical protein
MYYDTRPSVFCGAFDLYTYEPLKGYYPFKMFGELYRMGNYVRPEYEESSVYCVAAIGEDKAGVMMTNFNDDDTAPAETVRLVTKGVEGRTASLYVLDGENDMTLQDTFVLGAETELTVPLYSVFYLQIQ